MKLKLCTMKDKELETLYSEQRVHHEGDAGLDIFFPCEYLVPPKAQGFKVGLGIQCEPFPRVAYELYPRSSIGKTPLRLANSIGLIDPTYRGEIIVMLDNLSDEPFKIEKGTRLFQLVAADRKPIEIMIVNKLSETTRGHGGHGSTGK